MPQRPAHPIKFRRMGAHGLELLLLAMLLIVYCAADATGIDVLLPGVATPDTPFLVALLKKMAIRMDVVFLIASLGLLILTRLCRRRLSFLIAANTLVIGLFALLFIGGPLKVYRQIGYPDKTLIQGFWLPVPVLFLPLRKLVGLFVPFLFGLYCARRGRCDWHFILGYLAASYGVALLYYGPSPDALRVAPLVGVALAITALRLPLQGAAFCRLLAFSPFSAQQAPSDAHQPPSFAAWLAGHATLVWILAVVVFCIPYGHYERKTIRWVQYGEETPAPHSPALHNGYDELKALYCKTVHPMTLLQIHPDDGKGSRTERTRDKGIRTVNIYLPSRIDYYKDFEAAVPPELTDAALSTFDTTQTAARLADLEPFFAPMERAAHADYIHFDEPGQPGAILPNLVNLRGTSRALYFRACLRMSQSRPAEAVRDVETLLRFATLLGDGSNTLVTYMLSVAIRGIGLGAATQYYLHFRDNPVALANLETMMNQAAPGIRKDFDLKLIQRIEPGFWPITPYFELATPGLDKAYSGYYSRWITFDHLMLCLALERYRQDKGAYPERLESLEPGYLQRLPRDPFEGRLYEYRRAGALFTLQYAPGTEKQGLVIKPTVEWHFPTLEKDGEALRNKLEQMKHGEVKTK